MAVQTKSTDLSGELINQGRTGTIDAQRVQDINGVVLYTGTDNVQAAALNVATYATLLERGFGASHQTLITLTSLPISVLDTGTYGFQRLLTFPIGRILFKSSAASLTFTTTSVIASTLNSGVTVNWALAGTAMGSGLSGIPATTSLNMLPGTGVTVSTFTSSTVINTAPAAATGYMSGIPAKFDGSVTAIRMYLNTGVPTATDIDADSTLTVSGTILFNWEEIGTLTPA